MKRPIFLVMVLLVVILLIGCTKKEEVEKTDVSEEVVSYTFMEYLGNDKNGTAIKTLLSKIINDNDKLSDENKINVKLKAFKGNVSATNDRDKILKIYSYIGGNSSLYNATYDEEIASGEEVGNLVYIKQIEGSFSDPDIPIETLDDDFFIDESADFINIEGE